MIRYNLAELAAQRRATFTEATLPPQSPRLGTSRRYAVALRKVISGIRQEVNRTVIPVYEAERRLMRDADETTFSSVEAAAEQLNRTAEQMARRILDLEADRHSAEFIDKARQALGVDLTAVVRKNDLENLMRQATARNVSLIKSLSADAIKDVKQTVYNAGIKGDSVTALRTLLAQRYNVAASRADLIAQDQTSKFVADMNEFRQRQAGISEYDWMTSADERVRPRHQAIDGKRYKWGEATGAENGDPPGKPIRCRCVARGVVVWKRAKHVATPVAAAPSRRRRRATSSVDPGPVTVTPATRGMPGVAIPPRAPDDLFAPVDVTPDNIAKTYVLTEGRAAGVEFLDGYDELTGERTDRVSGVASQVGLTAIMHRMASSASRRMVFHHNHPNSGSFSAADFVTTNIYPGINKLWAHGHDGSSYLMTKRFAGKSYKEKLLNERMTAANRHVGLKFRQYIAEGKLTLDELNANDRRVQWAINNHIIMLILDKRKFIKYEFSLDGETRRIVEKYQWLINEIVDSA